jgi:hypothetical protein
MGYFRGGTFGGRTYQARWANVRYWGGGLLYGEYCDPGYYPLDFAFYDGDEYDGSDYMGAPVVLSTGAGQGLFEAERLARQGLPPLSSDEFKLATQWAAYRDQSPAECDQIFARDPRVRLLMERYDFVTDKL